MITSKHTDNNSLTGQEETTVLVLGGRGFIGREICKQLRRYGANVIVGTRSPSKGSSSVQRKVILQEMQNSEDWHPVLLNVDVVVNAVGILRQRHQETYEQVHHQAVVHLAAACAVKNVRLVHLSALGLENSLRSRFSTSKRAGEWALMNSAADWHIVRASLVDGEHGYGASWFRKLAAWPVHCVPANANGVIAPIRVEDLAECISCVALERNLTAYPGADRIFEVAGEQILGIVEYLALLKGRKPTAVIAVPALLVRCAAHLFDLLHLTPLSFGHFELLKYRNCPRLDRTMELLDDVPRRIPENKLAKRLRTAGGEQVTKAFT